MAYHSRSFRHATPVQARADRGRRAYHAGCAAEEQVEMRYVACGHRVIARRWRAGPGELDLVLDGPDGVIFVEVKQARNFDTALSRITPAKARRLFATADMFLGTLPRGTLTDCRFDVALVNQQGDIDIQENFFAGGL